MTSLSGRSVRLSWFDAQKGELGLRRMKNPFRYFNSSPEVIRLTVM
jgi:hypothetical protein